MTGMASVRDLIDGTDHDLDVCWDIGMTDATRYIPARAAAGMEPVDATWRNTARRAGQAS